ncbi:MAG: YqeG family HAD IIIA-type phosphatase [Cyanobacteria bacterium WB6_1B_304]|nr:YqeG family HAD IIIA-type phosphatase [Cyanobacteria bacterium WB6_1B_304]
MKWTNLLEPDLVIDGSILDLPLDNLLSNGLKGLVLDVDETVVPLKSDRVSPQMEAWINQFRQSFSIWLVSNNLSQRRIGRIAGILNLPFIASAGKPSRRKIRQAMEAMGLPPEQIGIVGDRLFTDVLAGNRLGLYTILVQPLSRFDDPPAQSYLQSFEIYVSQLLGASVFTSKHSVAKFRKSP